MSNSFQCSSFFWIWGHQPLTHIHLVVHPPTYKIKTIKVKREAKTTSDKSHLVSHMKEEMSRMGDEFSIISRTVIFELE